MKRSSLRIVTCAEVQPDVLELSSPGLSLCFLSSVVVVFFA